MLELKNIRCSYGKVLALDEVNIKVDKGTLVSIIGSNGSGKTTCLKAISRLIEVKNGEIIFNGMNITKLSPDKVVELGIIHIPERRMIFPDFTVMENIEIGAYARKDKKNIKSDLQTIFNYFPILNKRRKQNASTLSGGEQQMLAIARGLMGDPRILLLDEPSLGLAPILIKELFDIVNSIKKSGTTILLVEQNVSIALKISDYVYVLENGKISISGNSNKLLNNKKVLTSYLGIGGD